MIRRIPEKVWVFDTEWVPDPASGRRLYGLGPEVSDLDVVAEMWRRAGATEDDPMPFLKLGVCRVVSLAAVTRTVEKGGVQLRLRWRPQNPDDPKERDEATLIQRFFEGLARDLPLLVGYNSAASDLRILLQRAFVHGVPCAALFRSDGGRASDYLRGDSEAHLDLMTWLCGWSRADGRAMLSLHEAAALCGVPGKFEQQGSAVAELWLRGRWRAIVEYNCFDALTTYLLWLRAMFVCGLLDRDGYEEEQGLLKDTLLEMAERPESAFVERFLEAWENAEGNRTPAA